MSDAEQLVNWLQTSERKENATADQNNGGLCGLKKIMFDYQMVDQVGGWDSYFPSPWSRPQLQPSLLPSILTGMLQLVVHEPFPLLSFLFLSTDQVCKDAKSERRERKDPQHYRWEVKLMSYPFSLRYRIKVWWRKESEIFLKKNWSSAKTHCDPG